MEALQHPPHSPDFASTDYHLFRSFSSHIRGVDFENEVWPTTSLQIGREVGGVVNNDGDYIID